MSPLQRLATVALVVASGACAGGVYLPGDPGAPGSDVSGRDAREAWLLENGDADEDIRTAIREGVFLEGMTIEHRDVITNPDRRGTTGYGYWRSTRQEAETRYRWFVASEREPFDDGRGRAVCELVYRENLLREIRYCPGMTGEGGG